MLAVARTATAAASFKRSFTRTTYRGSERPYSDTRRRSRPREAPAIAGRVGPTGQLSSTSAPFELGATAVEPSSSRSSPLPGLWAAKTPISHLIASASGAVACAARPGSEAAGRDDRAGGGRTQEAAVARDPHQHLRPTERHDLRVAPPPARVARPLRQQVVSRAVDTDAEQVEVGVHRGLQVVDASANADFDLHPPVPSHDQSRGINHLGGRHRPAYAQCRPGRVSARAFGSPPSRSCGVP